MLLGHTSAVVRVPQSGHEPLRSAVLRPERQSNGDGGAGVRIRIAVERYIHAFGARVLDQAEVVQVTADALGALTVVRQMNGYVRPPAYLQGLLPRGEQARRQQAGTGVGVIEAAHARGGLRQRDQLVGVGVRAGRVVESGGKAPRALLHRLANDRPHVGHLVLSRRSVVPADAPDSHRGVAEYVRDVNRDGTVELAYEIGDCQPVGWHRRVAVES